MNKNILMGPETKNDCAGDGQQEIIVLLLRPIVSH
jgi:hypothetical protein